MLHKSLKLFDVTEIKSFLNFSAEDYVKNNKDPAKIICLHYDKLKGRTFFMVDGNIVIWKIYGWG